MFVFGAAGAASLGMADISDVMIAQRFITAGDHCIRFKYLDDQ